ncbi:MAG: type II toxin-antitoxin system VapC family toxin [Promethearchaeota archaeon]|nr:MAG: type II toxin-antitoxin system VapC family toxin [Candidatus Lokiarchaeota archaeon]
MIFLDSDAIIAFLRGKPSMAKFLAEKKDSIFAIATPALYEIYYGFFFPPLSKKFQNDKDFLQKLKREEQKLVQLINDIYIFELNLAAVKKSAEISALLDSNGEQIGKCDILIAGIILANGYNELLTKNKDHYEKIPDLIVYSY